MCRAGAWILGVAFRDARISHPGFPRYSEWRSSVRRLILPAGVWYFDRGDANPFALLGP
jgi:hypothetical protein